MIRFEKITKRLGDKLVLDGVDLEIRSGETFVIVGRSGTGKSVTLRHMVRLLTPDAGRVWVGDDVVSEARGKDLARIRARFGVLFQGGALLQWLTVRDNVALPLKERTRLDEDEIEDKVCATLRLVELDGVLDLFPASLSGGMQKRVALARAIIMEPEILLYDEPTTGLDPVTARTIDTLIDRLRQELQMTSVVVTHDLHSALSIGTRIAMLDQGRMRCVAAPRDFVRSRDPEVRAFLSAQYIEGPGPWEQKGRA